MAPCQPWSNRGSSSGLTGECPTGLGAVPYLDLEYAGEPSRESRWAEVVSAYLRREIGFDEAQGLLRYLRADNLARRLREDYDGRYDERYCPDGVWRRIR